MSKQTVAPQLPSNGQSMIAFVFDFPSTDEQRLGQIMVGSTGKMFHKMCEILNFTIRKHTLQF